MRLSGGQLAGGNSSSEKAEVIEIYNIDGTIADERIISSNYDSSFTYEVGKTVEVQDFDINRWNECTKGKENG